MCFIANSQQADLGVILAADKTKKGMTLKKFKDWKTGSELYEAFDAEDDKIFNALNRVSEPKVKLLKENDKFSNSLCTAAMEEDMNVQPSE